MSDLPNEPSFSELEGSANANESTLPAVQPPTGGSGASSEHESLMAMIRQEIRQEMAMAKQEIRQEIRQEMAMFKQEIREEMAGSERRTENKINGISCQIAAQHKKNSINFDALRGDIKSNNESIQNIEAGNKKLQSEMGQFKSRVSRMESDAAAQRGGRFFYGGLMADVERTTLGEASHEGYESLVPRSRY